MGDKDSKRLERNAKMKEYRAVYKQRLLDDPEKARQLQDRANELDRQRRLKKREALGVPMARGQIPKYKTEEEKKARRLELQRARRKRQGITPLERKTPEQLQAKERERKRRYYQKHCDRLKEKATELRRAKGKKPREQIPKVVKPKVLKVRKQNAERLEKRNQENDIIHHKLSQTEQDMIAQFLARNPDKRLV